MPIVTIDGRDYDFDTLSAEAKGQIQSIQFVDAEMQRLTLKSSVLQTARLAYSRALQAALKDMPAASFGESDTIKFN